jgi:hypothetical protein
LIAGIKNELLFIARKKLGSGIDHQDEVVYFSCL